MKRIIYSIFVLSLIVTACNNQKNNSQKNQVYEEYTLALKTIEKAEDKLMGLGSGNSKKELLNFMDEVDDIEYFYNPMGLDSTTLALCKQLKERSESLKKNTTAKIENLLIKENQVIAKEEDMVLESEKTYPVYLEKGEKLKYDIQYETAGNLKIYNASTKKLVRSRSSLKSTTDSLEIAHNGIYLIQLIPQGGTQYVSANLYYNIISKDRINDQKKIKVTEEPCASDAFMAKTSKGVNMKNIFENPRKFTLRSQLKSVFSGTSRAIVPIVVPNGTTDILYSVRISTSEQDKSEDGNFYNSMNHHYKEIRFMNLPVYKSTKSIGILNMMLDDNHPISDQDAYCNMYVFRSSTDAKKFQDETLYAKDLAYDIDYSKMGTQSCDGRIPLKGYKKIYLGFENERVRYSNYIWVEAIGVVPATEYHHAIYSIEE